MVPEYPAGLSPLQKNINRKRNLFEGFRLINAEIGSQCVILFTLMPSYTQNSLDVTPATEYSFIHFATLVLCVGAFAE